MEPSTERPRRNRAEQPIQFTTVRDCETWLATLSQQEKAAQPPLQRLATAVKFLQAPSSRQRRKDVQRAAKDWDVVQYSRTSDGCKKRKANDVAKKLEAKVLREATRLRNLQMHGSTGAFSWSALHNSFANASA